MDRPDRPGSHDTTAAATPTAPAEPPGVVTPERVAVVVDRLPALARQILDQSGVPGMAVAVVYDDAVVFAEGFGVRELGKDAAIGPDTVFQIASMSKAISSTVVAAVVGKGMVSWDSRMAEVAPGFALPDAWPTLRVIVQNCASGLPSRHFWSPSI